MEENSAAVECLIRFYINMKYFLKTRLVHESDFIHEMVKYCKQQQGFYKYSDKEIRSTWNKIVSKYASLKIRGSTQERETWKHFEILDSCYEESDFQDGLLPKFSEEMVWFLIECFLKRKTLGKTQRRNSILDDIHKEFMLCGYLNVTKHDIENKWKHLNLKYEKIKHDPEKLIKFPYLQALSVFHEEKQSQLVSMVFTKDLTEILIECFTKNKIFCIIHGYDSDKVLSEIQAKFGKLGFYFSKEAIKQKWRKLTTIYKFLVAKGENDTSWIYFEPMRNHFNDDYLLSCNGDKKEKQKGSKPGHLRQRSKSVGARNGKIDVDGSCVTVKSSSPEIFIEDQSICITNNKSVKRSFEGYDKNNLPRRRGRPRKNVQSIEENQLSQNKLNDVRRFRPRSISECSELSQKNLDEPSSDIETEKLLESKNKSVKRLKLNDTVNNSYKKFKTSETPNRTEEIIKNNQSSEVSNKNDIQSTCLKDFPVRQTQNVTNIINSADKVQVLPDRTIEQKKERTVGSTPITKQFDNELLPFKKRLRVDIGRIDKSPPALEAEKGTLVTELKNQLPAVDEVTTEIEKKTFQNNETNDTLENFGSEALKNNQLQDKLQHQNTFEGEHQKNMVVQNPDINSQNPCLLSVSKMNGVVKSVVNQEEIIDLTRDNNLETGETIMQEITETSAGFIKPTSPKNNTEHQTEDTNLSEVSVSHIETSVVYNNISEIVPDMAEGANLQVDDYNPNFYPTDNEQVCTKLNDSDHSEVHIGNSEPYPTQEHCYIENKHCEVQEPDVPFRKPLPVVKETADQIKWCTKTKTFTNPLHNTGKVRFINNKILISRQELNQLPKLKLVPSRNLTNVSVKQTLPGFKFVSQVIKPAASARISTESEPRKETNAEFNNELINDGSAAMPQPLPMENRDFCHRSERSEEFESESVISEAVGDDGLKDNLLATVIDFQEQNNQEFIEIKNLMKQNNLLQRETNRLLRLLLERL